MLSNWFSEYKAEVLASYRAQKEIAHEALDRCDDRLFFARLREEGDEHTNSIAILVKHISGNFRSRWTDFLTTDGEKPNRQREREFIEEAGETRAAIMQRWETAWQLLFATLEALREEDFDRTITIRGQPHRVIQAIQLNLLHAAHHIGQIHLLATALQ
jgi:uncharacterized damage-inducible protein DinB